jgi:NADPH:quinone reductase-like Zn-dependent oxidoreductase
MATAELQSAQVAKATTSITSTTEDNLVVLTPAIQKQVKALREARNVAKQAKALGDTARDVILEFVGETTTNLVGVDAKGKRLISLKLIPSSESFDWARLQLQQPELFEMLKKEYTIPRGAGAPTPRVDTI